MTDLEKQELNNCIKHVLLHQFKKDMDKDAIKQVEDAGFTIVKVQGGYEVKNKKTDRWVRIQSGSCYTYIHNNKKTVTIRWDEPILFDFVNFLNKELNMAWAELQWHTWNNPIGLNKYRDMASKLTSAKWNANYYAGQIKETRRKIEKLQEELEDEVRRAVLAEERLKTVRTELGLSRR